MNRLPSDLSERQRRILTRVVAEYIATGHPVGSKWLVQAGVSQPLEWALVGSGEAPECAPSPDWVMTVSELLDAGASLDGITSNPDEPKQPGAAVLELLRSRGLAGDTDTR